MFDALIGIENTEVINGRKYTVPLQAPGSHPFFSSPIPSKGSLTFNGQRYFNLSLLYDVYSGEVVVQWLRATGTLDLLVLEKTGVEGFRIHDHTFINYRGPAAQAMGIAEGVYDVLFESASFTVMASRKKDTEVEMGRVSYQSEDKYFFVPRGGKAIPFRGMKNFSRMLDDKALTSDLRSFVKKNNLKIRERDSDLIAVAVYCDTLLAKRK